MEKLREHLPYWVYVVLLVALGIGYVIGHTLPEFHHTIHRQIFADNMTTATVYGGVAFVYWMRIRERWPADDIDRWWTQLGVIGTFFCWGLHRIFWSVWRHFLDAGNATTAEWWRDTIATFTSILQVGIWAFALVMIWPTIQKLLGEDRWWVPGLTIPSVWLIWFGLQTVA